MLWTWIVSGIVKAQKMLVIIIVTVSNIIIAMFYNQKSCCKCLRAIQPI